MAVSKLFTPRLRASQATAIRRNESVPIFMNPPTHAEIPVFYGPTDTGEPQNPLHTCKDRGSSITPASRRPIASAPQDMFKK